MPSPRRLRLLLIATLVAVVLILVYTSNLQTRHPRDTRSFQDFYQKTMRGMSKQQAVVDTKTGTTAGRIPADKDADGDVDDDDRRVGEMTKQRLRAAEQMAKDKANEKALRPDPPSQVVGMGSSAEGQERRPKAKAGAEEAKDEDNGSADKETPEEHEAEQELNAILRKAPVIIFSKTYCRFSKRAKGILLDKYNMSPAPHVVELDEHPLGKAIQALLSKTTGRSTVPNIMVSAVSIGGSDEIVDLDNRHELESKIRKLAGKRIDIEERFSTVDQRADQRSNRRSTTDRGV